MEITNAKTAKIYINGKLAGSYGRMEDQTDCEFMDEATETEAYLVREAYHETNHVESEIKYE